MSIRQLLANWVAALSLPFVHCGLAKDFWCQLDRYLEIEKGLTSTFFVIPRKGDPGQDANGPCPSKRSARYDVADIADQLHHLHSAGHEIGLHGIDAWRDSAKGREELEVISLVTGELEIGVRMHWLFFDESSPVTLEKAGFSYDSTVGYNETVGYRAGTTQAFKQMATARLLELPMHIMDTAMFYPDYMDLSPKEARAVIRPLVENAVRFGGVVTVNWHDRSIAPERLWDASYVELVGELKSRGAWFSTAAQSVAWFRKRRSAAFERVNHGSEEIQVMAAANEGDTELPGLRVRVHDACNRDARHAMGPQCECVFEDLSFNPAGETRITLKQPLPREVSIQRG
jgi:peptidoglycan/xylan/chitin deacetylase (PgdA/CDA1 family)